MTTWLTILGMATVSYALRGGLLVAGRGQFPPWLARGMAYVPIALFAALALPGFLRPQSSIHVGPEAVAGLVAALVAWRTSGRTVLVLAAGVAAFLVARLV